MNPRSFTNSLIQHKNNCFKTDLQTKGLQGPTNSSRAKHIRCFTGDTIISDSDGHGNEVEPSHWRRTHMHTHALVGAGQWALQTGLSITNKTSQIRGGKLG